MESQIVEIVCSELLGASDHALSLCMLRRSAVDRIAVDDDSKEKRLLSTFCVLYPLFSESRFLQTSCRRKAAEENENGEGEDFPSFWLWAALPVAEQLERLCQGWTEAERRSNDGDVGIEFTRFARLAKETVAVYRPAVSSSSSFSSPQIQTSQRSITMSPAEFLVEMKNFLANLSNQVFYPKFLLSVILEEIGSVLSNRPLENSAISPEISFFHDRNNRGMHDTEEDWECMFVNALLKACRPVEMLPLQPFLDLSLASLPTLAPNERLLSVWGLLYTVLFSALAHSESAYQAGAPCDHSSVWSLLEIAPSNLDGLVGNGPAAVPSWRRVLVEGIEDLKNLMICIDVLGKYIPPVPLSVLYSAHCNRYKSLYREWIRQFPTGGDPSGCLPRPGTALLRGMGFLEKYLLECRSLRAFATRCKSAPQAHEQQKEDKLEEAKSELNSPEFDLGEVLVMRSAVAVMETVSKLKIDHCDKEDELSEEEETSSDQEDLRRTASAWIKFVEDVRTLKSSWFTSISLKFVAQLVVYLMVSDAEAHWPVLQALTVSMRVTGDGSDNSLLISALRSCGLTDEDAENIILSQSVESFDSFSSISDDLEESSQLLSLIVSSTSSPAVRREAALRELAAFLKKFDVDVVPLKLRLASSSVEPLVELLLQSSGGSMEALGLIEESDFRTGTLIRPVAALFTVDSRDKEDVLFDIWFALLKCALGFEDYCRVAILVRLISKPGLGVGCDRSASVAEVVLAAVHLLKANATSSDGDLLYQTVLRDLLEGASEDILTSLVHSNSSPTSIDWEAHGGKEVRAVFDKCLASCSSTTVCRTKFSFEQVDFLFDRCRNLLSLLSDKSTVNTILADFAAQIERKLQSQMQLVGKSALLEEEFEQKTNQFDENIVQQLVSKGFSRNGSVRAGLAVNWSSFKAALTWAVEHSIDENFDYPVAIIARGSLRSVTSGITDSVKRLRLLSREVNDLIDGTNGNISKKKAEEFKTQLLPDDGKTAQMSTDETGWQDDLEIESEPEIDSSPKSPTGLTASSIKHIPSGPANQPVLKPSGSSGAVVRLENRSPSPFSDWSQDGGLDSCQWDGAEDDRTPSVTLDHAPPEVKASLSRDEDEAKGKEDGFDDWDDSFETAVAEPPDLVGPNLTRDEWRAKLHAVLDIAVQYVLEELTSANSEISVPRIVSDLATSFSSEVIPLLLIEQLLELLALLTGHRTSGGRGEDDDNDINEVTLSLIPQVLQYLPRRVTEALSVALHQIISWGDEPVPLSECAAVIAVKSVLHDPPDEKLLQELFFNFVSLRFLSICVDTTLIVHPRKAMRGQVGIHLDLLPEAAITALFHRDRLVVDPEVLSEQWAASELSIRVLKSQCTRFLLLTAIVFCSLSGTTASSQLEFLQRTAVDIFRTCGEDLDLSAFAKLGSEGSEMNSFASTDWIELRSRSQKELEKELVVLRKARKLLARSTLPFVLNVKLFALSDDLLHDARLALLTIPPNRASRRNAAISTLVQIVEVSSIKDWIRAVGGTLDLGTSELTLLFLSKVLEDRPMGRNLPSEVYQALVEGSVLPEHVLTLLQRVIGEQAEDAKSLLLAVLDYLTLQSSATVSRRKDFQKLEILTRGYLTCREGTQELRALCSSPPTLPMITSSSIASAFESLEEFRVQKVSNFKLGVEADSSNTTDLIFVQLVMITIALLTAVQLEDEKRLHHIFASVLSFEKNVEEAVRRCWSRAAEEALAGLKQSVSIHAAGQSRNSGATVAPFQCFVYNTTLNLNSEAGFGKESVLDFLVDPAGLGLESNNPTARLGSVDLTLEVIALRLDILKQCFDAVDERFLSVLKTLRSVYSRVSLYRLCLPELVNAGEALYSLWQWCCDKDSDRYRACEHCIDRVAVLLPQLSPQLREAVLAAVVTSVRHELAPPSNSETSIAISINCWRKIWSDLLAASADRSLQTQLVNREEELLWCRLLVLSREWENSELLIEILLAYIGLPFIAVNPVEMAREAQNVMETIQSITDSNAVIVYTVNWLLSDSSAKQLSEEVECLICLSLGGEWKARGVRVFMEAFDSWTKPTGGRLSCLLLVLARHHDVFRTLTRRSRDALTRACSWIYSLHHNLSSTRSTDRTIGNSGSSNSNLLRPVVTLSFSTIWNHLLSTDSDHVPSDIGVLTTPFVMSPAYLLTVLVDCYCYMEAFHFHYLLQKRSDRHTSKPFNSADGSLQLIDSLKRWTAGGQVPQEMGSTSLTGEEMEILLTCLQRLYDVTGLGQEKIA